MKERCMGCMENFEEEFDVCPHCGYVAGTKAEEVIHMEPGTILYNRYIIGKVLGYGGFGVTYIGWDGKLEQKVAIKEYLPSEFSTRMPGESKVNIFNGEKSIQFQDGLNKFIDEAKRLAKFQNEPGIVKVFDSFTENKTAYIVMEFLDGETLSKRLVREKTIPEDEAVSMLMPVMESLQNVHGEGILHRDIAPDNIFLTKSGEVKLIDFGASRYATTSYSRSLTVLIKPGYSPAEQYGNREEQGPHTDVYAIGATLYKMITGKTPPDAMERLAMYENREKEILEEPHKLNKDISIERENAILNAMNVRIEDRTSDMTMFMAELNSSEPVKRRYGKIRKIDLYTWPLWLKILLPILMVALLTLGILIMTDVIKVPSLFSDEVVVPEGMVIVPDVEGLDKDEALELIEENHLIPLPEGNVESEYVEVGKIVLQTPVGGSYLSEKGEVVLTVSSGAGVVEAQDGMATVPYVIWDAQEEAVAKLKQAGLAEPIIIIQEDENVEAGKVISQSVEAGIQVDVSTQITITVSNGKPDSKKEESEIIAVSNVVGKSRDNAISVLQKQGFKVGVTEEYSSKVAAGNVISQTPKAGTNQTKGTTITICVSKGKEKTVSEWVLASKVPAGAEIVEQKWTYDLTTYKQSNSSAMAGYTLYDTKTSWSSYGGWSNWSTTPVTKSDSRDIETKYVEATYKTQYNYSKWTQYSNGNGQVGPCQGVWSGIKCNYYFERGWSDSRLSVYATQYSQQVGGNFNLYGSSSDSWFNEVTRQVEVSPAYTLYRYRDRTLIYTYYFKKTESKESTTEVKASSTISNVQKWVRYRN